MNKMVKAFKPGDKVIFRSPHSLDYMPGDAQQTHCKGLILSVIRNEAIVESNNITFTLPLIKLKKLSA